MRHSHGSDRRRDGSGCRDRHGAAVIMAIDQQTFAVSVPLGLIAALAAITGLLGVVAATLAAQRAARLDVRTALQYD